MESKMRFLVTGSSGFIGRHLVWYLNENEHFCGLVDIIEGVDITNYKQMRQVFNLFKPEAVYHLAAQVGAAKSEEDPELDWKVNVEGSLNIIKCMIDFEVNVGIFVSTQAVHEPTSNYAVSKLAMEEYVKKYTRQGKILGKIVRFSSCYGPDRYGIIDKKPVFNGPVNRFIHQCLEKQPITIYGDGLQKRDFIEVTDCCKALELVRQHGQIGKTYNIGTGVQYTIQEIATLANFIVGGRKHKIDYKKDKGISDLISAPFNVRETFKLGFVPKYDLYKGMCNVATEIPKILRSFKKVKIIDAKDIHIDERKDKK